MDATNFGLGCMGMQLKDKTENIAVIDTALDNGVTFLNTGDFYSSGESEMVLGEALKGKNRASYTLSVKFGGLMKPQGGMYGLDVHPDHIKNYLTHSLKRLQLDYIDLYQPCRIDGAIPIEETIGAISDLVKEGYVRNIGISEVDAETLRRANSVHPIEYVEMDYSLFNRSIEQELLPTAHELGIKVVAFGLLAHGLLKDSWTRERVSQMTQTDFAPTGIFEKQNLRRNIELIEDLRIIAQEKNVSIPQLAFAWAETKNPAMLSLIGASRRTSFEDSFKARNLMLTDTDINRIEAAVPADKIAGNSMRNIKFLNGKMILK
ncbi:aldo/keto reductase [Enterococcus hermanniensis]|nr:aldo/keto reductase [Enterococcus hermanniensis]